MNEQKSPTPPPILKAAWKHYADYDHTARQNQTQYYTLRKWVLIVGVLATVLAILLDRFHTYFAPPLLTTLQVGLILLPIIGSALVSYVGKFQQGYRYLILRSGAEEILKEIYRYRTIMQHDPRRDHWLQERLAQIQRRVHRALGGEVLLIPYQGEYLNPNYDPQHPETSDDGAMPLDGDAYVRVRLLQQREWHAQKMAQHHRKRRQLTVAVLAFGGLGALLGGLDILFTGTAVWVTLTTALASAITNWQELLGVDEVIPIYSKVVLELDILRDRWESWAPEERTQDRFYELVQDTEDVLWSQHMRFVSVMKEVMDKAEAEQEQMVKEAMAAAKEVTGAIQTKVLEEAQRSFEEAAAQAAQPQEEDEERLPPDMLLNVALGPRPAGSSAPEETDAPDGFEAETETEVAEDTAG